MTFDQDSQLSTVALLEQRIGASNDPSEELLHILVENEQNPHLSAAIFEAVAGRLIINHYWTYYKVAQAYFLLGRDDACFMAANSAIQMEPTYPSWHMFDYLFVYLRKRGLFREAANLLRHQVKHTPEIPIRNADELRDVVRRGGSEKPNPGMQGNQVTFITLEPSSIFELKIAGRYGSEGDLTSCYAIESIRTKCCRPEVVVAEVFNAEIIIYDGNIVISDEDGNILTGLSVSEFPDVLLEKVKSDPDFTSFQIVDANLVQVIGDKYTNANVCHFLYDHISRLALYERIVGSQEGLVIGPSIVTEYQRRIVERCKIKDYLGSTNRCIVRARRLLVSSTCKATFVHPAHFAAFWAVNFLRTTFAASNQNLASGRKLYISRSDAAHRVVRNEGELLSLLERHGFIGVPLSTMTYDEQVELFRGATHVVGMHGAGLTGLIFCPAGAKILEICHPIAGTAAYAIIGSVVDVDYSFLVGADADSDALHLNNWRYANSGEGMAGFLVASNRDVIVDLTELDRWLSNSNAK